MIATRKQFEALLPAFRTPTGDIFDRMAPTIEQTELELIRIPDYARNFDESNLDINTRPFVAEAAITRAAYNLIPQLDLVLTPTGFGIVSNQNTAPASRERVTALREEIRHIASDKYYAYIKKILKSHYSNTSFYNVTVDTFFWTPDLANQYGLRLNGQTIYKEELEALKPRIVAAEIQLGKVLSDWFMRRLRAHDYEFDDLDFVNDYYETSQTCAHYVRLCLSHMIMGSSPDVIAEHENNLLQFIKDDSYLSDLLDGQVFSARKMKYENKKDDTTFFFA